MEKNIAISARDIKKTFRIPHEKHTSMKQAAVSFFQKRSFTEFNVLRGISFDIYEGDFFGIVGRNGSGKSTLLKILAGIYTYDSGSLVIKGKISPFLELGVGFNPELTGRENVFLNGAILGLTKKEVEEKYDEIVRFSELTEFMDQKLKNYSSGMQVRLAFSVAIHAHAPIILLDEVLAVGDSNFQRKCEEVFVKLKKEGRTIVFVSHNMEAVKKFCNRTILINEGKIVAEGEPEAVTAAYDDLNFRPSEDMLGKGAPAGKNLEICSIELTQSNKGLSEAFKANEDMDIIINISNKTSSPQVVNAAVGIYKDEVKCFDTNTFYEDNPYTVSQKGKGTIRLHLENISLAPGVYYLNITLFGDNKAIVLHAITEAKGFVIVGDMEGTGVCNIKHIWD